jgi:metal-responsive CopG/Arc/MetJ family transcriptional regulator
MWSIVYIRLHIMIRGDMMRTIQVTIDEPLLAEVDQMTQALNTTRSAFIREALELAVQRHAIAEKERKHAEGYIRHPVEPGEFDVWEDEQAWGEP